MNLNENLMNKFGRISKTIKSSLPEAKNQISFSIVLPSNRQWFHISEFIEHSTNSLGEPRCLFLKKVNNHRAVSKTKIRYESLVSLQFAFNFPL